MDNVKEIRDKEESGEMSWKKCAIKQGYLINFHRGLLKAPKMQYFVLTANGLISFEGRPHHDSKPLCFLPYQRLSSIKLDQMELNSCRLCCMQLTSKTSPSFTLAFSSKEDRDEWMMIMMKAFSEALLTTRVFNKTPSTSTDEDKATASDDCMRKEKLGHKVSSTTKEALERTSSYGQQSVRRKRRKGEKGSIRKSKSYDSLALHDVTNTASNFPLTTKDKRLSANPLRPEAGNAPLSETRKRKSEPDVHVISHFPSAWTTDRMDQLFANSCSFEHRDSLTVQAEKQLRSKSESKHKSNVFAKLRSKLEHPVKYVH